MQFVFNKPETITVNFTHTMEGAYGRLSDFQFETFKNVSEVVGSDNHGEAVIVYSLKTLSEQQLHEKLNEATGILESEYKKVAEFVNLSEPESQEDMASAAEEIDDYLFEGSFKFSPSAECVGDHIFLMDEYYLFAVMILTDDDTFKTEMLPENLRGTDNVLADNKEWKDALQAFLEMQK